MADKCSEALALSCFRFRVNIDFTISAVLWPSCCVATRNVSVVHKGLGLQQQFPFQHFFEPLPIP